MTMFGTLIKNYSSEVNDLDLLFSKSKNVLKKFDIEMSERQIALNQLRKLTTELQIKRLRNKIKSSSNYFTL